MDPQTQQKQPKDLAGFRSFVLQNQPNISAAQLKELDGFIEKRQQETSTLNMAENQQLDPATYKSLQTSNPQLAEKIGKTKYDPTKGIKSNAAEIKKKTSFDAITNFVNNLEGHYQGAGGADTNIPIISNLLGKRKDIEGALQFNPEAKVYNDQRQGFVATIKELSGDTGVLTKDDADRLFKLLPELGETGPVAQAKLNDLRSQIAAKFGGQADKTTIRPANKNILDVLMPGATNTAQDINAGVIANITGGQRQQTADQSMQAANSMIAQSQQEQDPARRKALYDQAQSLLQANSQNAGDVAKTFSSDVGAAGDPLSPWLRGLGASSEIVAASQTPGTLKGGYHLLKNGKNFVQNFFNSGANQARLQLAKQAAPADMSPLVDAGNKYADRINPAARKAWETLKPALGEKKSMADLLEITSDWGTKAYTQSGDVRAIAEGQLKNHLYKTAREMIKTQSPEIAQLTKDIATGIGRREMVSKGGKLAGTAVVTGLTYLLLSKFLNPQQGQASGR